MSFHFFFANKDDFLLDKLRPIFATSTSRKLSSHASYAMRIRRASDDAELDVGFAGNSIDEQAIKDFGGYNLLGYTENVENSSLYVKSRSNVTEFGTFNGNKVFKIVEATSDNDEHYLQITLDNAGNNTFYTFSAVAKAETRNKIRLAIFMPGVKVGAQDYNLSNGTIANTNDADNVASGIESLGNNFYKIYLTVQSGANTLVKPQLVILNNTYQQTYVGDGKGVLITNLQMEISNDLPKIYQPRTTGGASDCFVTTLYDQSGNGNDATQTVVTNQPKVYDVLTGEVTKENGKPAMVFDGVDDILSNNLVVNQPNTFVVTAATKDSVASGYLFDGLNERQIVNYSPSLKTWRFFAGKNLTSSTLLNTNQNLFVTAFNGLNSFFSLNNNVIVSGDAGNNSLNGLQISSSTNQWNGVIQEMIIFDRNLTTKERTLLHSDINNHFNIY